MEAGRDIHKDKNTGKQKGYTDVQLYDSIKEFLIYFIVLVPKASHILGRQEEYEVRLRRISRSKQRRKLFKTCFSSEVKQHVA